MSTICAIATSQGGAIGIVRVSGGDAIGIVSTLFEPKGGKPLSQRSSHTLSYGTIRDEHGESVDDVLVGIFRSPHSYTGEDSVEISCHGSAYVLTRVVELLLARGCKNARPGEFTQRAFLNGRMDLSQAEAVADLIAAKTRASHQLAMSQMRGRFSDELRHLRDRLLEMTSLLELELDFSEEDVEFADRSMLLSLATEIEGKLSRLADSFRLGNVIRNGVPVAIIGETNVGKSTLLNRLLHDDRAIVSDVHGTTRDVIEDNFLIGGVNFRFMDTAGIRQTDDEVENLGIGRTYDVIDKAQIVLWLIDASRLVEGAGGGMEAIKGDILAHCADKHLIVAVNKADLVGDDQLYELYRTLYQNVGVNEDETIRISAKTGYNIEALETMLTDAAHVADYSDEDVIVSNLRHYEALTQALSAIRAAHAGMDAGLSADLVSEDLRLCLHHLADIVGEVTNDEVLANIFSRFCIGK